MRVEGGRGPGGLRRAGGGRGGGGCDTAAPPWVAGGPEGLGCGLVLGAGFGGKVRPAQSIPAREQRELLYNLSPSSNWGSVPPDGAGR